MHQQLLTEEWAILASLLPPGWEALAKELGALQRVQKVRGISSPATLLRIILLHAASGLSLHQTVVRAQTQGLASMSDVALLKRLRSAEPWLRELTRRMFDETRFCSEVRLSKGRKLRAVDATTVEEPGATGTDWRVHYSICLPDMACDFYEVTGPKGGETYKRIPIDEGDIILADRGYCHRDGVAHVVAHKGDVIVRLNSTSFPLLTVDEKPFDILANLRTLNGSRCAEWAVKFVSQGRLFDARLCALRSSQTARERAQARALRYAKKHQTKLRPETLEFAEYVFVLTTVRASELSTAHVMELYRARWQIELAFKRMKSLMQMGHVPKRSDLSARAWIQAKLLTVMIIERLLQQAKLFSPWGYPLAPT
jgi:hypothetical protein